MPAFTNINVGSFCGTKGAEVTNSCPLLLKKSKKLWRILFVVHINLLSNSLNKICIFPSIYCFERVLSSFHNSFHILKLKDIFEEADFKNWHVFRGEVFKWKKVPDGTFDNIFPTLSNTS